jgi:hypothetical protein
VRALAIALTAVAVAAPAAAADAPPRFAAVTLRVHAAQHRADLTTIVEDDPGQILDRAYRTTLYYRCGAARTWKVAVRSGRTGASVALVFRYAASLHGQRCAFRARVVRTDSGLSASSVIVRRRL